jgi:hypothetical protein
VSCLALLVGVSLSLAVPMPSTAEESPSPSEFSRTSPLRPDAFDGAWRATAAGLAPWSVGMGAADAKGADTDTAANSRLILQLGMLFALLYVAFLCVWLSTTRHGPGLRHALQRVRAWWAATLASSGAIALTRSLSSTADITPTASSPWTCEIAWKRGPMRSRFQAVVVTPDDRKRRVVAESIGLPWPPSDARNPPTQELEAALGALIASIVATGWEPVQSNGSWSEQRFVWRRTGEPPTKVSTRSRSSPGPEGSQRNGGAAHPRSAKPTRRSASRDADTGGRPARRR